MAISARPVSHYARLSEHPGPWADPGACLTLRFPATACHACREACPVSVLDVDSHGIRLSEGCLRCGRCAAACPTHALSMPGWQIALSEDAPPVLKVDCAKVPDHLRAPGSVQVPCLGGLSHSRLLQWVNTHSPGHIALMDRGWCQGCDAGGSEHPAAARVAQINRWLAGMGVPEDRHVRLVHDPLPIRHMADEIPDPSVRQTVSRRGFLRQLAGQVAVAAQGADEHLERTGELAPVDGSARIHPAERIAVLARLSEAARDSARTLPADLFHTVRIDQDRCRHDTICARCCPTAALSVWHSGGDTGVQFDPSGCIGCGECARLCPQQAIQVEPGEPHRTPVLPQTLSRHAQRVCGHCHASFVADERHSNDEDLPVCPACDKSQGLMASEFERLFGRRDAPADLQPQRGERSV
jgi:Fe-S-cluster-containing hydrogenase component 2